MLLNTYYFLLFTHLLLCADSYFRLAFCFLLLDSCFLQLATCYLPLTIGNCYFCLAFSFFPFAFAFQFLLLASFFIYSVTFVQMIGVPAKVYHSILQKCLRRGQNIPIRLFLLNLPIAQKTSLAPLVPRCLSFCYPGCIGCWVWGLVGGWLLDFARLKQYQLSKISFSWIWG